MIVAIVVTFVLPSAYHLTLAYVSIAIMFFLVRKFCFLLEHNLILNNLFVLLTDSFTEGSNSA